MDILFLSHCVPNPPDKGEKIRGHHALNELAGKYRVHLACFARGASDMEAARELSSRCASVYVEPLSSPKAHARAALRFAVGGCLNTAFYGSGRMRRYVNSLARRTHLAGVFSLTAVMVPYVPEAVPLLLDMVDVDSEKWFQYGRMRSFGFLYSLEGRRMRQLEIECGTRAARSLFTTRPEEQLFRSFAPSANTACVENGVDFEYFDPAAVAEAPALKDRRFLVFVGTMDYYPNSDAVCWFAQKIFPELRRRHPSLEFFIVGRNPPPAVLELTTTAGITVTGAVSDIRPYLNSALAFVAPLRLARGIQNKVLEALAMGKPVFATTAVSRTFGDDLPDGITPCSSEQDFITSLSAFSGKPILTVDEIRSGARRRFSWPANMAVLSSAMNQIVHDSLENRTAGVKAKAKA